MSHVARPDPEPDLSSPHPELEAASPSSPREPPARWWGRPLAETRWSLELSRLLIDPVFAGFGVPRGDGRPVILVPGFLAGNQTLAVMAGWLYRIGYRPHLCRFLVNVDCGDRAVERLERKLVTVTGRSGRRAALIGHSRGGHYVRALAARRPDLVSHAVSLGADLHSMLDISAPTLAAVGAAGRILTRMRRARSSSCFTERCDCRFAADFCAPFPSDAVRFTSVYSKGDGVVRWRAQIVPHADCVEVSGSHVGLVFNRKSYRAIAHALARPELTAGTEGRRDGGEDAREGRGDFPPGLESCA